MTNPSRKRYARCYITTPIFYPSGDPHAGTAYSALIADFLKRHRLQRGVDAFLTTGTDEHGKKMAEAAAKAGIAPQAFVDANAEVFRRFFAKLHVSYDRFVRTTEPGHERLVQSVFARLKENGHVAFGDWRSLYCTGCEENYTPVQAAKGPDGKLVCRVGHELAETNERSYFAKVSAYGDWVMEELRGKRPDVFPEWRVSELARSFLDRGLKDLSVSRESVSWGVKVPGDEKQTVYVWVDALFSYLSALGYGTDDDAAYRRYWDDPQSETIHVIGKEITRFHCLYWPIFLKMLGVRAPVRVLAHGWLVAEDGSKMSKSLGNAADPVAWIDKYGVDAVRYFFLKALPPDGDSRCGENLLQSVYNADLANSLGNLVSRVAGMARKYQDGAVLAPSALDEDELRVETLLKRLPAEFDGRVDAFDFGGAFKLVLDAVAAINRLIEDKKPWTLHARGGAAATAPVVWLAAACARTAFALLLPVFPNASAAAFAQLGLSPQQAEYAALADPRTVIGARPPGGAPLFERLKPAQNAG